MKKKRDIEDYLKDIVENIDKIVKFTSGISYEDFVNLLIMMKKFMR